jgi:hypothetical protein
LRWMIRVTRSWSRGSTVRRFQQNFHY